MTPNTPTPRTAAKEQVDDDGGYAFVSADFARQLERELQQATELHADLKVAYEQNAHQCVQLNRDLARVTAEWEEARKLAELFQDEGRRRYASALDDLAALRARVTELERMNNGLDVRCSGFAMDVACANELNAELVAALEWALDKEPSACRCMSFATPPHVCVAHRALTRAESATPAKCKTCGGSGMTAGWVPTYENPDNSGGHQAAEPCPDCEATQAKHPDADGERLGAFAEVCPHCGAQTMDPFTGTRQIHDVDACTARKQGGSHD